MLNSKSQSPTTQNNQFLMNFAMMALRSRPDLAGNPRAQEMIRVLQSGDAKAGEALAENLLQTYGVSKEDAIQQASSYFGQMFGGNFR